jgi:hypothetical protein
MKRLPAIAILALMCSADQPKQPECTKKIQGFFWPQAANADKELARKLYQSGELQMCAVTLSKYAISWKYKWQFVSVNARDLGKGKRSENAKSAPAAQ